MIKKKLTAITLSTVMTACSVTSVLSHAWYHNNTITDKMSTYFSKNCIALDNSLNCLWFKDSENSVLFAEGTPDSRDGVIVYDVARTPDSIKTVLSADCDLEAICEIIRNIDEKLDINIDNLSRTLTLTNKSESTPEIPKETVTELYNAIGEQAESFSFTYGKYEYSITNMVTSYFYDYEYFCIADESKLSFDETIDTLNEFLAKENISAKVTGDDLDSIWMIYVNLDKDPTTSEYFEIAEKICNGVGLVPDASSPESGNTGTLSDGITVEMKNAVLGDANNDSKITIADSTAILQALGNPDKYALSAQGEYNADVYGNRDGITPMDAVTIQQYIANLIDSFDSADSSSFEIKELLFGYYDESLLDIMPDQRIAMKCKSFCYPNETLTVDVAMGDNYSQNQELGSYPDYDTLGHAEYGIYSIIDCGLKDESETLIVNGESGEFLKEYSRNEMELLDISGKYGDFDSYHHETAEINFSNYKPGNRGCIVFTFAWKFDEENPYNPSSQYIGNNQYMFFYVGEKGVAISNLSTDYAIEDYQKMFGT